MKVLNTNNFIGFTHPLGRDTFKNVPAGNQWGFDSVNLDAKDTILESTHPIILMVQIR